jgi:hypothetical protein
MKNLWNNFYNSRVGQYLIYGIMYITLMQLVGFELAAIMCLTTILGEIHFQYLNHK